jgi:peptidoglycan/LPS O-acetylase OafA/YrhL
VLAAGQAGHLRRRHRGGRLDGQPSRPAGAAQARALRIGALVLLATALGTRQDTGGADAAFHGACGVAFALLVLAAVAGPPAGAWQRVVGGRVLVWCGTVSYSLYLWHEPLLHALAGLGLVPDPAPGAFPLTAAVLVAAGLAVAWVSWCLVEHPGSQLRSRVDGPQHGAAPIVHRTAA